MRRALAAAALALALTAGTASADTFEVVSSAPPALPSAETPNAPGALFLPPSAFPGPFAEPQERSYEELQALWLRAGAAYGIPWQVLAAINKIESNFGRNMGPSSAGAVGWMQFMPDTWLRWGTDGDGDGVADPWDPEDAVYAAARYLAAAGGRTDLPRAVFAYNHAQWYVDDVLELADLFGGGALETDVVFALDRLGIALEAAQEAVAAASDTLRVAEEREAALAPASEAAAAAAEDPALLVSDLLTAQKTAFGAENARFEASVEVERLRSELATAESALEAARSGAHASSFAPAAASLLGGPSRADGYVFPVGGGPSVVTVGRGHHDYPAADIAAPQGSPVYALADAIVLEPIDDNRCGIGVVLQTEDGLVWVYCHLSHRDEAVLAATFVTAGQWIGLVGSTGRSSGPHLHLALKPETAYPQELTWFREFAGIGFSWQDAPAQPATRSGAIFAVVPTGAVALQSDRAPAEDVVEFTLSPAR